MKANTGSSTPSPSSSLFSLEDESGGSTASSYERGGDQRYTFRNVIGGADVVPATTQFNVRRQTDCERPAWIFNPCAITAVGNTSNAYSGQQEQDGAIGAGVHQYRAIENQAWRTGKKRQEIILYRGSTQAPVVGSVNFHHWLTDLSRDVVVAFGEDPDSAPTSDLKRDGITATHSFAYNGKRYEWRSTRAKGMEVEQKALLGAHYKCVESETKRTLATYVIQRTFGRCKGKGVFSINAEEGVPLPLLDALILTCLAVSVKARRRRQAGALAGVGSGAGTVGMMAITG